MGTREMEGNFLFGRVPYWPLVIAFVFWRLVMYCWARARNKGLTHWWGIFSLFSLFPNSRNATLGDIRRRTICILINLDASVSVVCSWGLQLYAVSRCTTRAPSWPSHKLSLSSLWSCKGEDESHPRLVDSASVSSDPTTVHHSSRDTKRPGSELKSIMDSAVLVGVWGCSAGWAAGQCRVWWPPIDIPSIVCVPIHNLSTLEFGLVRFESLSSTHNVLIVMLMPDSVPPFSNCGAPLNGQCRAPNRETTIDSGGGLMDASLLFLHFGPPYVWLRIGFPRFLLLVHLPERQQRKREREKKNK